MENHKSKNQNHRITPKKSLGQHFIKNPRILGKIVSLIDPSKNDTILEIGCGQADLTLLIAKKAGSVIAVETDRVLADMASRKLRECDNCTVIEGDFLKIDIAALINKNIDKSMDNNINTNLEAGKKIRAAGNIPYNISSQIIFRLFEHRDKISDITFLLQKEMADRITAPPGSRKCGYLTIALDMFFESKRLYNISGGSFIPPAKVDSTLIRLSSRSAPKVNVSNEEDFLAMIKTCFLHRRKTLKNNLKYYFKDFSDRSISEEEFDEIADTSGISLASRPEELDIFQFKKIYDILKKIQKG